MQSISKNTDNVQAIGKSNTVNNDDFMNVDNPGVDFQLDWINEIRINRSAVQRRVATLKNRCSR